MQHTTKKQSILFAQNLLQTYLDQPDQFKIELKGEGADSLEALFLGTHGGNAPFMETLISAALKGNVEFRNSYFPEDPDYLDKDIQSTPKFRNTLKLIKNEYDKLILQLKESGTFYSMRSVGHMLWDTTIPGILGYFAALLYNQNNVAAEASPVTTLIEMQVGNELCKMLGYAVHPTGAKIGTLNLPEDKQVGWGHITCDGSIANLEALWMARNLKFYALSVKLAIQNEPTLKAAKDFKVTLLNGSTENLLAIDDWTLLNLPMDEVLEIPNKISTEYNIDLNDLSNLINNYTVQTIGYHDILTKYLPAIHQSPVSFCSGTRHYSWPKGAAILGIGAGNMINTTIDEKARMDLADLRTKLDNCLSSKIPVMNVVAIIGTTEESSVDPLKEILAMREEYRAKGMEFAIHADAAWGGYFKSMLNDSNPKSEAFFTHITKKSMTALPMSAYTLEQYKVLHWSDSITIDPHKSGYVPYPAGGLCYRNSSMRNLVSFTAPVVYHGGVDPTVGVYGVEGSKPGAAAAAVYMSHKVIRPDISGYGKISGECFFNAKRVYAAMVCMNIAKLPFFIVPLVPIPAIQEGKSEAEVLAQYEFIRDRIVNKTNEELLVDTEAFDLFKELGGDQTIITYMFNFYNKDGSVNTDMAKANKFNDSIYRTFSYKPGETDIKKTELVVTSSAFTRAVAGDKLIDSLRTRLKVTTDPDAPIDFIISTIMNPFLTNTVKGSFIPQLMDIMIRNLTNIYDEMINPKIVINPDLKFILNQKK